MLYNLPSGDFHDVDTGNNGAFTAGPGYDLATGLGTPIANLLVPDLVIPPTDNAQFLRGVFTDATGSLTAAGGFDAALAQLNAARAGLLSSFANTYVLGLGRTQLVQDLYSSTGGSVLGVGNLIGRALSPGEAGYWATQLQNGMSYEQMIVQLTGSTTYFAETGAGHTINGIDAAFVNQLYNDLLHRNPKQLRTELAIRAAVERRREPRPPTGREQPARRSSLPNGGRPGVVHDLHGPARRRGEIASGLSLLQGGGTPEQLIGVIFGTPEYFSREAPLVVGGGATASNDTLVRAMYKQLFPGYTSVRER